MKHPAERTDTIVAIATPPGQGGVGVVRLSGPEAIAIASHIAGVLPVDRQMAHRQFADANGPIDSGLVVRFDGPRSYTGEDVVELHGHGSPVALDLLVRRALELGARLAAPGEFTERAFLNDRLDLAEAEAVADLIGAGTEAAARAAHRSLSGEFSRQVTALSAQIEAIRVEVEASIDFVDEDLRLQEEAGIQTRVQELRNALTTIFSQAGQGRLLSEGCVVVLAGRPNAGKSSLLNALAGHDSAIVTEVAGTTRDVLRECVSIDGLPVTLLDTAGLRDAADPVELEGIKRAKAAIQAADHVLYLADLSDASAVEQAEREIALLGRRDATTLVHTKSDLVPKSPSSALTISAATGDGVNVLRAHLLNVLGYQASHGALISARRRHLDALTLAEKHLNQAQENGLAGETDLFAEDLRLAHEALGQITGKVTNEDLLGRIFSTFCIGK